MKTTALFIALILLSGSAPEKPDIYEWRGPDRTGIYNESGLLKVWPENGPAEIWSIDNIGNGYGSPTFAGDRFYITGEIDSTCYIFCFDPKGRKQWQTAIGKEWMRSCPGSRSAPTVAGDLVYTGTGMGNLFCINRTNGKIVWSKDLSSDFGGVLPLHGHSEAPLIHGDKIFWTPGGKVHNVVALNRHDGKLLWTAKGFSEPSAYNQPKLISHPSGNILVTFSSYHLMGFDVETGVMLWSHEQDNYPVEKRSPGYGDTHCNTVLYENGSVYYAAGDGNGGVRLDISKDGKTIVQKWRNPGFDSYMGGIVKNGDFIYGGGTIKPELKSVNSVNGTSVDSLRIGTGAVIAADDMLYYYTQKGDMMLIDYDNGKLQKISSFRITRGSKEHFSHPVINKGVLYQRHGNVLMAFDIKSKQSEIFIPRTAEN